MGFYDVGHVHTILGNHNILNNLLTVTRNEGEKPINVVQEKTWCSDITFELINIWQINIWQQIFLVIC